MSKSWVCKDPIYRITYEMELFHKFKDYQYFLIGYQDGYFSHVDQKDYDEAVDFIVTHIDRLRWIRTDSYDVVKALEKQIPKKPKKIIPYDMDIGFEVIHTQRGFCSSCGQSVIEEKHNFCPRCGAAVKWE